MDAKALTKGVGKLVLAIVLVIIVVSLFGLLPDIRSWRADVTATIAVGLLVLTGGALFLSKKHSLGTGEAATHTLKKVGKGILIVLAIILVINLLHFLARAST
jgi:hypothetical protein